MTHCDKYDNIMQAVLDGSASDRDREILDGHMAGCRACRNTFESLTFSIDLLMSAPVPAPGPDFTARTVAGAFRAGEARVMRRKYSSWCLTGLMVLLSTFLAMGWTSVMAPVARLGLRGLLRIFMDIMALVAVADKLRTILAELATLMRNAMVGAALGAGAPVLLGCLLVFCLMLFIFTRSGFCAPGGLPKRR
jgi:anti-sigma factor RsiW